MDGAERERGIKEVEWGRVQYLVLYLMIAELRTTANGRNFSPIPLERRQRTERTGYCPHHVSQDMQEYRSFVEVVMMDTSMLSFEMIVTVLCFQLQHISEEYTSQGKISPWSNSENIRKMAISSILYFHDYVCAG